MQKLKEEPLRAVDALVLGGSFDPVHRGHTGILKQLARDAALPSDILLVPTNQSPFKHDYPAPGQDRIAMLELALEEERQSGNFHEAHITILDYELRLSEPARTYTTLNWIQKELRRRPALVVGADSFQSLESWFEGTRLLQETPLVVAGRPGDAIIETREKYKARYGSQIRILQGPPVYCSSTEIRKQLLQNQHSELERCLHQKVLSFIRAKRLYARHP